MKAFAKGFRPGRRQKYAPRQLDYDTVLRAINGDEDAIRDVLRFYEPFIRREATRDCIDGAGRRTRYVDPFVFGHIEGRLMEAIYAFGKIK